MSQIPVLYGISNCDTVKKARSWMQSNNIEFEFHDFRKQGINEDQVQHWIDEVGSGVLLNRRGTTWRKLSEDNQKKAETDQLAALLVENPTLIKRPVLAANSQIHVGFKEADYQQFFG